MNNRRIASPKPGTADCEMHVLLERIEALEAELLQRLPAAEVRKHEGRSFFAVWRYAFQWGFGINPRRLEKNFEQRVNECLQCNYPNLRRSALRDLIEGRLTDGFTPFDILNRDHAHVQLVLDLADIAETLRYRPGTGKIPVDNPPVPVRRPKNEKSEAADSLCEGATDS